MSEVASKWGAEVAERGFAQIPNYMLQINRFLADDAQLSSLELMILIQLSASWWKKGELPFPSMKTLALLCGASERQIVRGVSRLEALGLLKRVKRRARGIISSNAYDLSPLVDTLAAIREHYPPDHPRVVLKRRLAAQPGRIAVHGQPLTSTPQPDPVSSSTEATDDGTAHNE